MGEQKIVQIILKLTMFILSPSQGTPLVKPPSCVLPSKSHSHPISTNTLVVGYLRERTVLFSENFDKRFWLWEASTQGGACLERVTRGVNCLT